jgi:hypothetical protein
MSRQRKLRSFFVIVLVCLISACQHRASGPSGEDVASEQRMILDDQQAKTALLKLTAEDKNSILAEFHNSVKEKPIWVDQESQINGDPRTLIGPFECYLKHRKWSFRAYQGNITWRLSGDFVPSQSGSWRAIIRSESEDFGPDRE